jgi:ribonuclease-3
MPTAAPLTRTELEQILGTRVYEPFYYQRAFVHASARRAVRHAIPDYLNEHYSAESYERMEFLGDSVLRLIIADYLYFRYPSADEGILTRVKSNLERRETLAMLSEKLGLDKYIMFGDDEPEQSRTLKSIKEDVFEAVVGAMYLDKDRPFGRISETTRWVISLIEKFIPERSILSDNNFKDVLQMYAQRSRLPLPVYECVSARAPFTVHAIVDGRVLGAGSDWKKRVAEQHAARQACAALGLQANRNAIDRT